MSKTDKSIFKKAIAVLLIIILALSLVFLIGRYGWKLFGFKACQSAGIDSVEVADDEVRIKGFDPSSFPKGFLGYHAEEKDGVLYVGFKFSGIFGIFEKGDFDITVPVDGEIKEVVVKTRDNEYRIWQHQGED